jgi:hypothetical protein
MKCDVCNTEEGKLYSCRFTLDGLDSGKEVEDLDLCIEHLAEKLESEGLDKLQSVLRRI